MGKEQRHILGRLIGKVGAFDETVETFEVYTERLDLYFEANGGAACAFISASYWC